MILHPTSTCQWYALVYEAQAKSSIVLSEDVESYVVFLLSRFLTQPEVLDEIFAFDFFAMVESKGTKRLEKLQEIGDKSLILCGIFPENAAMRNAQYIASVGQGAYSVLSQGKFRQLSKVYRQLSEQFLNIIRLFNVIGCK